MNKPCCVSFREKRAVFVKFVEAFNKLSGGNPLFLVELYDQLKLKGFSAGEIETACDTICPTCGNEAY